MSRFYGIVMGDRARYNATRIGNGKLNVYANTWIAGIEVEAVRANNKHKAVPMGSGKDLFNIYLTHGSNYSYQPNGGGNRQILCTLSEDDIIELIKGKASLMDIYLRGNSND